MLDDRQRLTFGVDVGPMERVAGYDFHIFGEMALERCHLGSFAGCLSTYDRALFGSCTGFSILGISVFILDCLHGPYCSTILSMASASTL